MFSYKIRLKNDVIVGKIALGDQSQGVTLQNAQEETKKVLTHLRECYPDATSYEVSTRLLAPKGVL